MRSMEGYFEHIGDKSYLKSYPPSIIDLRDLTKGVIVEFASGACNDARWMVEVLKVDPKKLFLIECDWYWFVEGLDTLEGCLECDEYGLGSYFCGGKRISCCHPLPEFEFSDVLSNTLPNLCADFVYANNCLHDFGFLGVAERYELFRRALGGEDVSQNGTQRAKERIQRAIKEAYRLLKSQGVFFGRMLSNYLNQEKFELLRSKSYGSEKEEFVLKTAESLKKGILTGLSLEEFKMLAQEVGFEKTVLFEIQPENWIPVMDFYFRCEK